METLGPYASVAAGGREGAWTKDEAAPMRFPSAPWVSLSASSAPPITTIGYPGRCLHRASQTPDTLLQSLWWPHCPSHGAYPAMLTLGGTPTSLLCQTLPSPPHPRPVSNATISISLPCPLPCPSTLEPKGH